MLGQHSLDSQRLVSNISKQDPRQDNQAQLDLILSLIDQLHTN